ncbi:uridine diphosphate-N-acetylglucosamine-binding protein YvcK [Candidatus Dojkabacteria bacterium]|nr:uridine diphosphate-N-acetylglucosamine-binding protein YvcK [Candidatus Dojkabacteria bacterium]
MAKKKVAVIGGGTGTVAVLHGLKKYDDLDLSVIVSMTDDGGSNAIVRDQFGYLPLSDLRKSIIALSGTKNGVLRDVFTYRFEKGEGLKSHTLGNLIMMGLSDMTGSEMGAIDAASKLFNVQGKIIPVTTDDVRLVAEYEDGSKVEGEHYIDEPDKKHEDLRIKFFYTNPKAKATKEAIEAIKGADYIIAGPGDLYTSTLANIIINGIPQAIQKSKGQFIFVNNLMTKKGQTHGMKASDLVAEIEKYSGRSPDVALLNNKAVPSRIVEHYKSRGEEVIADDLNGEKYQVVRASLIDTKVVEPQQGDDLIRSIIRHDSVKLSKILYHKIIKKRRFDIKRPSLKLKRS